jgi:hypothetical protein
MIFRIEDKLKENDKEHNKGKEGKSYRMGKNVILIGITAEPC